MRTDEEAQVRARHCHGRAVHRVEVEPVVAHAPQREPVLAPVEDEAALARGVAGRRALVAHEALASERLDDDLHREETVAAHVRRLAPLLARQQLGAQQLGLALVERPRDPRELHLVEAPLLN